MTLLFELILGRVAWSSTYTYLLLLFAAAAFVAYVSRPRPRGEAIKKLYAGTLIPYSDLPGRLPEPSLHVRCLEGGKVVIERLNVEGLTESGALSVAATFKGKDVEIEERFSGGYQEDEKMAGAAFEIDMSGREWRHVKWIADESGLWCAFTLHVREGIEFDVALRR